MILGTVQLGQEYGIGNISGKPSPDKAFELLDHAYHNEITMLDTAQAYGDSERIIGQYHKKTSNIFQICTKLPTDMSETKVYAAVQKSLDDLGISTIDTCYLHRFDQCYEKRIITDLVQTKNKGWIRNIGISIYEAKELEYILKNLAGIVDVVQLPFNIITKDDWNIELLGEAHLKFTLYARSIYLQGLLLMSPDNPVVINLHGNTALEQLNELAKRWKTSVKSLAWKYVQYHPLIDDFLVGCETLEQLKENIILRQSEDEGVFQKLQAVRFTTNEKLIDPRRWNE